MKRTRTESKNYTIKNTHPSTMSIPKHGSIFKTERQNSRTIPIELVTPKNFKDKNTAVRFFRALPSDQSTQPRSLGPRKSKLQKLDSFRTTPNNIKKKRISGKNIKKLNPTKSNLVINLKPKAKKAGKNKKKSKIENLMDKKLKMLSHFINLNDKKLRRNMSERRSLLEQESKKETKSVRIKTLGKKFKFGQINQKLKNFMRSKMDTVSETNNFDMKNEILCENRIMSERDMRDHKLNAFPNIEPSTPNNRSFQIHKELDFRDLLNLTGEKNRMILKIMRGQQQSELGFAPEIERRKKRAQLKQFKQVFCRNLGTDFTLRKKEQLHSYLKENFLYKNLKNKVDTKRDLVIDTIVGGACRLAGNGKKDRSSTRRRSTSQKKDKDSPSEDSSLKVKSKRAMLMRGASKMMLQRIKAKKQVQDDRLSKILKERPQSPFNLKKELWCPTQFIDFLESNKGLKHHFENSLTREIVLGFMFPKRFHNEVLSRKEIDHLIADLSEKFKKEEDLRKRVHLALIVCTDIAFKLKGVYKEQGLLLKMILGQVAQDFEKFRSMVGKNVYRTMKSQQIELTKVQDRRQRQAEACESRINILLERQEAQKKQNLLKDQESSAIKKLLYELQKQNELYLKKIQDLERKINTNSASARARSKFKRIIHKIIPERMSIMKASEKIMNLKSSRMRESISKNLENTFTSFKHDSDEKANNSKRSSRNSVFSNKNTEMKLGTRKNSERGSCFSFISHPTINEQQALDLLIPNESQRVTNGRAIQATPNHHELHTPKQKRYSIWNKKERKKSKNLRAVEQPKHIFTYLISDIEKVSRFYAIPDGTMKNQSIQAQTPTHSIACQTDFSLMKPIYNDIFKDKSSLRDFVKDFSFRQNLSIESLLDRVMDVISIRRKKFQDDEFSHYSPRNLSIPKEAPVKHERRRSSVIPGKGIDFYIKLNQMIHMARPSMSRTKSKPEETKQAPRCYLNQSNLMFNECYSIKKNFENYRTFFNEDPSNSAKLSKSVISPKPSLATQMNLSKHNLNVITVNSTESVPEDEKKQKLKKGVKNMMKHLKSMCKQVLQDHLRDELTNDNKFGMTKERKLILVSKFLFTEEIRVKDLKEQIQNLKISNQELKRLLDIPLKRPFELGQSLLLLPSYIQKRNKHFLKEEKNLLAVSGSNFRSNRFLSPMTMDSPCSSKVVSSMLKRSSLPDLFKLKQVEITSPIIRSIMVSPLQLQLRKERKDICFDLLKPMTLTNENVTQVFQTLRTNQNNSIISLHQMKSQMKLFKIQSKDKPRMLDFLYDFYLKNFGIPSISEKKLILLLVSMKKFLNNLRVNLFARFLGLIPHQILVTEELVLYLKLKNFILQKNCHPEKRKFILRTSEVSGALLLKNPKLEPLYLKFESHFGKNTISSFRQKIEMNLRSNEKEVICDLDAVALEVLRFQRLHLKIPRIDNEIFTAFEAQGVQGIYVEVFELLCKHFMIKEKIHTPNLSRLKILDRLKFQNVIARAIKEKKIGSIGSGLSPSITRNCSGSDGFLSSQSFASPVKKENHLEQMLFSELVINDTPSQQGSIDRSLISKKELEEFFNLDKISRAKLTKEGFQLKEFFEQNYYDLKSDIIKFHKKLKYASQKSQQALRFLFGKLAKKFDSFNFKNIGQFFIIFYVIKKEIN